MRSAKQGACCAVTARALLQRNAPGLAWHANDRLMLTLDVRDVMWRGSLNMVTIRKEWAATAA